MRNSGFPGDKVTSLCARWAACHVVITMWMRLKMLHVASVTSLQLQNSQISNFSSSAQKGALKIRLQMSHGMHQTHITTPSALFCCDVYESRLSWFWGRETCAYSVSPLDLSSLHLLRVNVSPRLNFMDPLSSGPHWTTHPPPPDCSTHCAIKLHTAGMRPNPKGNNGVICKKKKRKIAVIGVKWLRSSTVSWRLNSSLFSCSNKLINSTV